MAEGQYRIVKAQLPLIGGLAGHNFLALIDPDGNVMGELHGLATGADGLPKPIGHLPSDELKGYHDQRFYKPNFAQTELASGDQAEIMKRWNAGRAVLDKINARNIHYPWMGLGQNSNSFASTLIAAMGLNESSMRGGASVVPGARSMLLDPKDIQDIQRQFNIGADPSGDAPDSGEQPGGVDQQSPLDSAKRPFGSVGAPGGRTIAPPARAPRSLVTPPQDLPSTAVSGAKGPTSLGGPNGPAPLTPPRPRSQAPTMPVPAGNPTLPPLQFASDQFSSPAFPPTRFPLEALLAPDRNRALDQWASSSPQRDPSPPAQRASADLPGEVPSITRHVPSDLDWPPAGGLLGMIQEYMRNHGY
ncbi:hypothetical protein N2603_14685 [Bradyrhizobium huanghuaihaiense]|uniref:hypothetical protein n=1 Tax=Bradyrhizobium huanghuaihaiense TaxID=990078 RepID=UPI0021AA708B|nr:hypothetical protein [Bradyrhizobium sp. CB3035]UWU79656.1 hypothetical protein N2603_14685 [Bradyrhizobium sp. CB3035]